MNCGDEMKWRIILAVVSTIYAMPVKNSGLQQGLNLWPGDAGVML